MVKLAPITLEILILEVENGLERLLHLGNVEANRCLRRREMCLLQLVGSRKVI